MRKKDSSSGAEKSEKMISKSKDIGLQEPSKYYRKYHLHLFSSIRQPDMTSLEVLQLSDCDEQLRNAYIKQIAEWSHSAWGVCDQVDPDYYEKELTTDYKDIMQIIRYGGQLVGMFSLKTTEDEHYLWHHKLSKSKLLEGVYIDEKIRDLRLGKLILNAVKKHISNNETVWLKTTGSAKINHFYQNAGATLGGEVMEKGFPISVLRF